jgi:hypothetical protein
MIPISAYNISDIYWNPVDFSIVGDQFTFKKQPVTFSNGMSFNTFEFLKDIEDLSFNNKSGIILTNLNKNSNILEEKNLPQNVSNLTLIESPIASSNDNYTYKITNNSLSAVNDNVYTLAEKLIFELLDDDRVVIQNNDGLFLTNADNTNLTFRTRITPLDPSQVFNYLLGDQHITLFSSTSNYTRIIGENSNRKLILKNFSSGVIPQDSILKLVSFLNEGREYNSLVDSFIVKYDANPLINQKKLIIKNKDSDYIQNYLGVFPDEHYSINNKNEAIFKLYFHPLKNYQTTEYDYSNNKINRVYKKIYSGTKQSKGLDKIHLGYQTSAIKIEFSPSTLTPFYFSPTSEVTPLSSAGLIEDGAIAGEFPYTSDRIFTSIKSNFKELQELTTIATTNTNNRFLCSWLSNKNNQKTWYDRYYNSAYYTVEQALTSSNLSYNDKDPNLPYLYDIPSATKLVPGSLYEYYHMGKNDSVKFLKDLELYYDGQEVVNSNVLSITNWLSSPITDDSVYHNDGLGYERNVLNFKGDYWHLDGTNHAVFPAKSSLLQNDKLTVSLWLNVEDWSNINGYQIFGNYYDSGFGLICDTRTFAPLITIANASTGKMHSFNYRFAQVSTVQAPTGISVVQRMSDLSYWLFDTFNRVGYRYTVDDKFLYSISIDLVNTVSQIEFDNNENIYIYDNTQKKYIQLDKTGTTFISLSTVSPKTNRIEIDLDNDVVEIYGNASVIDNLNNIWEIIGTNLYKNRQVYAFVGESTQMVCDNSNNLWILGRGDSFTKINADGTIGLVNSFSKTVLPDPNNCPPPPIETPPLLIQLFEDLPFLSTNNNKNILNNNFQEILVTEKQPTREIPDPVVTERIRTIGIINVPSNSVTNVCAVSSVSIQDRVVIIDSTDNEAYILNNEGVPISKINFNAILGPQEPATFFAFGDFTGYDYIRKFRSSFVGNNFSWRFSIAQNATGQLETTTVDNSIKNINAIIQNQNNAPRTRPNSGTSALRINASNAILTNKANLQQQVIDYLNLRYPSLFSASPTRSSTCYRDLGYIIDAVAADILNRANHRSVEVGNIYFVGTTAQTYNNSVVPTLPPADVVPTIEAISVLGTYMSNLISDFALKAEIVDRCRTVAHPLLNRGVLQPYSPAGNPSENDQMLATKLLENKVQLQNSVASYVQLNGYITNSTLLAKCRRDVGLIIDALINDLNTGVNSRSIQYGLAYWSGSTTRLPDSTIPNQIQKTIDTFNYLGFLIKNFTTQATDQRLLVLNYPIASLPQGWHHFTFTFNSDLGVANYYIDGVLVDSVSFPQDYQLFYNYRTSLLLGATTIKNTILNNLLNIDDGYKFVGDVGELRMYSISLNQNDVQQLYYSSRFSPENRSLKWNMNVGKRNYIEEISNWFQFQLPTNKSKYFNINVHNLEASESVKTNIELAIRSIIDKLSPANASLYKIKWK